MKILVTHISLNPAGGGERVCLSLVKALRKPGNWVTLATVDKTDWHRLCSIFGETAVPNHEFYLFSNLPKTSSGMFNSFLLVAFFWAELLSLRLTKRHHLFINTCGEKIDSIVDVAYVNGIPLRCVSFLPGTSVKRRCYSVLYNLVLKIFDRVNNSVIIVNSGFDKGLFERCVKKKALVVYPQVNVKRFKDASLKRKRENIVVTYSQYVPTQNLDYVPRIARNAGMANFIITGPSGTASKSTFEELRKIMAELSVEERVKLLTDQPFSEYIELLSTAKVFLRTLQHEPFGMSVVEAMAAGCVPLVPRDGGPWFDILEEKEGIYGFSYGSTSEAAQKIGMLLENEELRVEVSARASRRALNFDSSVFEDRISSIVKNVYLNKLARAARRS